MIAEASAGRGTAPRRATAALRGGGDASAAVRIAEKSGEARCAHFATFIPLHGAVAAEGLQTFLLRGAAVAAGSGDDDALIVAAFGVFRFPAAEERRAFIVSFTIDLLAGESVADDMRWSGDRRTPPASRTGRTPPAVPVESAFVRSRTQHFLTCVVVRANQVRILPATELRLAFVLAGPVHERTPIPFTCQMPPGT